MEEGGGEICLGAQSIQPLCAHFGAELPMVISLCDARALFGVSETTVIDVGCRLLVVQSAVLGH